jgi:hypothetical protein
VSDNVRVLAAARGTSPGAVALSVGRTRQWIQAKMAGRNGWSVADVDLVATSLGVEPALLMSTDWWPETSHCAPGGIRTPNLLICT